MFGSIAAMILAVTPSVIADKSDANLWACQFAGAAAVGCFDISRNDDILPAKMYEKYGFSYSKMTAPGVREALTAIGCRIVNNAPPKPWHLFSLGTLEAASLDGTKEFRQIIFEKGTVLFFDDRYLKGTCPLPPRPSDGNGEGMPR